MLSAALYKIYFYLYLMNYLQEHGDDLRRRLVSLAHFDTTTENDELVTLLTMETFREHMSTFWKRTKAEIHTFTFGGEERWHLRFVFV